MAQRGTYRDIHEHAVPFAEPLCERWLPQGKRKGGWWGAPVPWGEDRNPSLIVSLSTGWFQDRALNEKGDLLDLCAKVHKVPLPEAAEAVAIIVGHPYRRTAAR